MPRISYTTEQKQKFLENIVVQYNNTILSKKQIDAFCKKRKLPVPYFIYHDEDRKISHGKYSVAMVAAVSKLPTNKPFPKFQAPKKAETPEPVPAIAGAVITQMPASIQADVSCTVPEKDPTYVPFGNYDDVETIIRTKVFFPVYITGMSGNGKTMSIIQACAKLKREILRINVTEETDELDLIGGTELVNGSTVNREGAVLLAMRRGAVLLIDEGDLNNTKILCLMPILEGKPYFNKKTGEVIHPAEGFNIFITGNTKGKGSEDGRFVGTKVMNEAFLERFAITMEQEYPDSKVEKKIVVKNMELYGFKDDDFATKLCTFAEISRKTFAEGAIDEIITTRRLTHIVKAFAIFQDRAKAIKLALNRFDAETKNAFMDLYSKIDASVNPVDGTATPAANVKNAESIAMAAPECSSQFSAIASSLGMVHNTTVSITPNTASGTMNLFAYGRMKIVSSVNIDPKYARLALTELEQHMVTLKNDSENDSKVPF
jgi:MoxR-like ATPase